MAYGTLNAGTITPGSGNTLTVNEAVTFSGAVNLGTPSAGVVTNLSGVLPVGVTGGSGLDAIAVSASNITSGVLPVGVTGGSGLSGLQNCSTWYLTSTTSASTSMVPLTGWTEDTRLGSAMVVDGSGYWTFPSTGYWFIQSRIGIVASPALNWGRGKMFTRISGSDTTVAYGYCGSINSGSLGTGVCTFLYDVTNVDTHLFHQGWNSTTNVTVTGGRQSTVITFTRMGDT